MKENEGASMGVIGKILGEQWKNVSDSDRKPFETKAAAQKKTYQAKMEKYQKSANYRKFQMTLLAWKIHETKKPFGKDENAPKRSLSAYMLYAAAVRSKIVKENPDMEVTEVMREQSVWWKSLSEDEQQKWKTKAAAGKKKYEAQVARYMKTADYQTYVTEREAYKAEMLEKRNKLMGIKKRARTPTKAKSAPRSPSKKKQKRRSRTPKASKSRSVSRRRAKSPKNPKKRSKRRRASKRRSKAPKASKRSASRSTSRRARTPKAPKARRAKKERTPKRRAAKRRSKTPKASKSRSASRSSKRRASTPKA